VLSPGAAPSNGPTPTVIEARRRRIRTPSDCIRPLSESQLQFVKLVPPNSTACRDVAHVFAGERPVFVRDLRRNRHLSALSGPEVLPDADDLLGTDAELVFLGRVRGDAAVVYNAIGTAGCRPKSRCSGQAVHRLHGLDITFLPCDELERTSMTALQLDPSAL
jgi:hypothetical protein